MVRGQYVPIFRVNTVYLIIKRFSKGMTLESKEHTHKTENSFFWARLAKFGQVGLISIFFFFFFFFGFGFYGPFKNISLISSRSFIEGGRKPENPEKNHLTIRKQNLAFPRMTRARLEPQR